MNICKENTCTACGACRDICPKQCVSLQANILGELQAVIDEDVCISCGLCAKICPNNNKIILHPPKTLFAAWSNNPMDRHNSASGGIAAEFYKYYLNNDGYSVGVIYDREKGCYYTEVKSIDDLTKVRNSKYAFSDTNGIYRDIKKYLNNDKQVLFIGLPCQVAGLYAFLRKPYENLLTIDIICHGTAPTDYLQQHISRIERQKKQNASLVYFRDPKYYTYTFTFTFTNKNNQEFYKNTVKSRDLYQLGYHRALIYRENCYQCQYARMERSGDLTIGDFTGLGRLSEFQFEKKNVSSVLVNTEKGAQILKELESNDVITIIERPLGEARFEGQLNHPSAKHANRDLFIESYKRTQDFYLSAKIALKKDVCQVTVRNLLMVDQFKIFVVKLTPRKLRQLIKKIIKR